MFNLKMPSSRQIHWFFWSCLQNSTRRLLCLSLSFPISSVCKYILPKFSSLFIHFLIYSESLFEFIKPENHLRLVWSVWRLSARLPRGTGIPPPPKRHQIRHFSLIPCRIRTTPILYSDRKWRRGRFYRLDWRLLLFIRVGRLRKLSETPKIPKKRFFFYFPMFHKYSLSKPILATFLVVNSIFQAIPNRMTPITPCFRKIWKFWILVDSVDVKTFSNENTGLWVSLKKESERDSRKKKWVRVNFCIQGSESEFRRTRREVGKIKVYVFTFKYFCNQLQISVIVCRMPNLSNVREPNPGSQLRDLVRMGTVCVAERKREKVLSIGRIWNFQFNPI